MVTRPVLTPAHKRARLDWARDKLEADKRGEMWGDNTVLYLHIDEKWFNLMRLGKVLWIPPGASVYDEDKVQTAASKTKQSKVMFLAAVGFPRAEHGFDGGVGIWPVVQDKVAKRHSKYHRKDDVYKECATMNTKVFVDMVRNLVVPAAVAKAGTWARKIVIQMDSAGGHGVDVSVKQLTFTHESGIEVVAVTQPTKSPDLNVLDLGAWYSLDCAVFKHKRDLRLQGLSVRNEALKPEHDIIQKVEQVWATWVSKDRIMKLFQTCKRMMEACVRQEGGNLRECR